MALICGCGQYLGTRSVCPSCGRPNGDAAPPPAHAPAKALDWGELPPPLDDPSFADGPDGHQVEGPPIPAAWGELRGVIATGESVRLRAAGGLTLIRLLGLVVVVAVIIWKANAITVALTNVLLSLLLKFLLPIIVVVVVLTLLSKVVAFGGCLGQLAKVFTFSALTRGVTSSGAPNGWRVTVENAEGATAAEIAAPLWLQGGEEVSLHGPAFGGVKHAWLIQVLGPRPTTRLARGVLSTLISVIIGLPLVLLLAIYL